MSESIAYSPADKFLAIGYADSRIRVWDVKNAKLIHILHGHNSRITSLSFSDDSGLLAARSLNDELSLWNMSDLSMRWKINNKLYEDSEFNFIQKTIFSSDLSIAFGPISFSKDNKFLLPSCQLCARGLVPDAKPVIALYNTQSGNIVRKIDAWQAIYSSDGSYVVKTTIPTWTQYTKVKNSAVATNNICLNNIDSNDCIWSKYQSQIGFVQSNIALSPSDQYAAFISYGSCSSGNRSCVKIFELRSGKLLNEFGDDKLMAYYGNANIVFSPDSRKLITYSDDSKLHRIWKVPEGVLETTLKTYSVEAVQVASMSSFSPDGKRVAINFGGSARIFDVATGDELATLISFEDGEWLAITPNGYYNSSEKGDQYLSVSVQGKPYTIAQLREAFYRPDLVKHAMNGGSLQGYRTFASVKPAPNISFIQTPPTTGSEQFTVTLNIEDQGGGVGDIRLFVNGAAVLLENSRSLKAVTKASFTRSYNLKLPSGTSTIRAIAFNADNTLQSGDATHTIVSSFKPIKKPSLHAVVVGIQEFKNPKLQLNFAQADAQLFSASLSQGAKDLFDEVKITSLTGKDVTSRDAIIRAMSQMKSLSPDDLFIFYIASHGTVDDGEYFLITSNVGALGTQRLKSDALSQTELKEMIANIPSTKKLIIIDTCNAGQLGSALQTAMMARGMSEDTAMKVLSRAVGSTILSASTSTQEALEGYKGHGLFTWSLVQGLSGKADKGKTGFVKTTDLATYVEDEVPILAEQVFKRAQYPTISISGQGFPISKSR